MSSKFALKLPISGVGIIDVYSHLDLAKAFEKYMAGEYSIENILFLKAVHGMEESNDQNNIDAWQEIYDGFIAQGAGNQVNIPSTLRGLINIALAEKDVVRVARLFQDAVLEITTLIRRHSWAEFTTTKAYEESKPILLRWQEKLSQMMAPKPVKISKPEPVVQPFVNAANAPVLERRRASRALLEKLAEIEERLAEKPPLVLQKREGYKRLEEQSKPPKRRL